MKKLLGILVLGLLCCNVAYAKKSKEQKEWEKNEFGKIFSIIQSDADFQKRCKGSTVEYWDNCYGDYWDFDSWPANRKLEEWDNYIGKWKSGDGSYPAFFYGPGVMYYKNKDVYFGFWKNSNRHGQGTYEFADGSKYVGGWKDNVFDGQGTLTSKEDNYVGGFKGGKYHGQGTITFPDGGEYVGEWKDNVFDGQGTLTFPDGGEYVGEWKDGKFDGQGAITTPDGEQYVGEWKDNVFDGQGTLTSPDGEQYVGEWKGGEWNGLGTHTHSEGKIDMGIWKNGELVERLGAILIPEDQADKEILKQSSLSPCKKNDYKKWTDCKGIYLDPEDKNKYTGDWKDGKFDGQGTYVWVDGTKYVGEWKDDKKHGEGNLTLANGDTYVGEWKDDKKHGEVNLTLANGDTYVGEFKEDLPHGQGTFTPSDTNKIIDHGIWFKDKLVERQPFIIKVALNSKDKQNLEKSTLPKCEEEEISKWVNCKGIIINESGQKYVGEFKQGSVVEKTGERNGQGFLYDYETENIYFGEFKNDKFDGQGTYVWVDGTKYVGEWKDDKKHGEGNLTLANGDTYVGEFKEDLPHGQGVLTIYSNKQVWKGKFENGESLDKLKAEKKEAERLEKIRKKEEAARERERLKKQKEREKAEKKRKKEKSKTGSGGLGKYNTSAWKVKQGAGIVYESRDLLLFATQCVDSSGHTVQEALTSYWVQASNLHYQKNYNGSIRASIDLMNLGRSYGARNCDLHLQDRFRN